MKQTPQSIKKFQKQLLTWYHQDKRNLPFRKTKDPYKIWLSEIMLQQTTMTAVLDYYKRFVKKYPTVDSVAIAKEEDLLHIWQGLGYYSRIRNFQAACQQVASDFKGKVPTTYEDLKKLKGIGDYTAAAISSICFNEAQAVIDGNVKRVLARLFCFEIEISSNIAKEFFVETSKVLLDQKNPGDYNQALMELGALVCTPKSPRCLLCPIKDFCKAYGKNPEEIPIKKKQKFIAVEYTSLVIHTQDKILLKKPHSNNLIKNMWELPSVYEKALMSPKKTWQQIFKTPLPYTNVTKIGQVKHGIMNKRILNTVYEVKLVDSDLTKLDHGGFTVLNKERLEQLPVNTISRKILKKFCHCYA